MRRSKSREKRNKIIISIVFAMFMVTSMGSVVVYYGGNDGNTFRVSTPDGVYKFTRKQDSANNLYYEGTNGEENFVVYTQPEALFVDMDEEARSIMKSSSFYYFTFSPHAEDLSYLDYMRFDIQNNLPSYKYAQNAVTTENATYQLPVITCSNATPTTPVILFNETNQTSITTNNYCINVEFATQELLIVRDALVYLSHDIDIGG